MKKKILLISESMGGGLRKHVVQLIENLNPQKYEIFFIHGTNNLDETFLNDYDKLKRKCHLLPCHYFEREIVPEKDYKAYKFVSRKIGEIKPDIVHCHSSKAGVIGRVAAKRHGVKKIFYTPHAYSFLAPEFNSAKKILFVNIERFLSRFATSMTFNVSINEKKLGLKNRIDTSKKFKVIYNGLPELDFPSKDILKQSLGFNSSDILIGNNARMSDQKNPMLFLKVAKKVICEDNRINFIWAGDGPLLSNMKNYIVENKLEKNVHRLGDRKDSEIIVSAYDIYFLTSLYEGLPYSLIESLRAGVPIIASYFDGIEEVIDVNVGRYTVDENMLPVFLLEQVKDSNSNSDLIKKTFNEKFSLSNMIANIEENYEASCE